MKYCLSCLLTGLALIETDGFATEKLIGIDHKTRLQAEPPSQEDGATELFTRRGACNVAVTGSIGIATLCGRKPAYAEEAFRPAIRPTAYRVDSTQPPTLLPLTTVRKEMEVLKGLGRGSGTDKDMIAIDTLNLNNMLNKAVFGSIDTVSRLTSPQPVKDSGPGYASFVCLGVPTETKEVDIDLAASLIDLTLQGRKGATALSIACFPLSSQADLDKFLQSGDEQELVTALTAKGVSKDQISLYLPLVRVAKKKSLNLLALAPEKEDIATARREGLQNVSTDRRSQYVVDTDGFIQLSSDPRFRLYTERSLLKDFTPYNEKDNPGDFFSERILVHETAATAAAQFAVDKPDSLVLMVAPTPDLRYLNGINGRIARLSKFLNPNTLVTGNAVTTILLNPSAKDTLSKSRYLRLEIGTGPETLDIQTKVADYLWFSSIPKVNLIPRLMNG